MLPSRGDDLVGSTDFPAMVDEEQRAAVEQVLALAVEVAEQHVEVGRVRDEVGNLTVKLGAQRQRIAPRGERKRRHGAAELALGRQAVQIVPAEAVRENEQR